jgi:hypothetical protein
MPYQDPDKQKAAQRQHYKNNKNSYRKRALSSRRQREELVKAIKDKPCADCGKKYPFYVMQLDHIKGAKVSQISSLVRSRGIAIVRAELEKCEVVCANCHAARSYKRSVANRVAT